jgi:hypothetical protein
MQQHSADTAHEYAGIGVPHTICQHRDYVLQHTVTTLFSTSYTKYTVYVISTTICMHKQIEQMLPDFEKSCLGDKNPIQACVVEG